MRQILDSRLRVGIPEHWPSLCTIRSVNYTLTASQQRVKGGVSTVAGMINIPCRIAAFIETRMTDDERRTNNVLAKIIRRTLKLNGYFPTIDTRRMVAVVDGTTYEIRGVEHDSEKFSTRLRLEILTP